MFMLFTWNKSKEDRKMKKRQKQETRRKHERQEGSKKAREREISENSNSEKGGGQKRFMQGERKRNIENKQKMPFSRGKNSFFCL